MTPDQRARNSAQKWLKISIQEMMRIAANIERDMAGYEGDSVERAQNTIVDLRQSAKRCSHHGLGVSVQSLLPLEPKETKI